VDEDQGSSQGDLAQDLMVSTKIRHLLSILNRDASKHKYIVFSFFTSMLDLIEPFLKQDGLVYTRYDGAMRNDLREASLERLRNHSKTRILLCSLRAGSLGLNLTAASRVVILEPFWNPFVEEQAIDRVHRLNQTQDVIVYKITVKDTVEARILDLQERKRELANATIEGKSAAAKLTLQDMLKLFRHDAEHSHGVDGIGLGKTRLLADERQHSEDENRSQREGSGGPAQVLKRKEHEIFGRRW
jgi:SNF2 family DNA or RNA helicase